MCDEWVCGKEQWRADMESMRSNAAHGRLEGYSENEQEEEEWQSNQ